MTRHHFTGDDVGFLFTTGGNDAWRVISYCSQPTVMLENLETKERRSAAVGAPLLGDFKPLQPRGAGAPTQAGEG